MGLDAARAGLQQHCESGPPNKRPCKTSNLISVFTLKTGFRSWNGHTMRDAIHILRCPQTHRALSMGSGETLFSDANTEYSMVNGIAILTSKNVPISTSRNITEYYDAFGWSADEDGVSKEIKVDVDTRAVPFEHTRRCISRLQKYFVKGGKYLLDLEAGLFPTMS